MTAPLLTDLPGWNNGVELLSTSPAGDFALKYSVLYRDENLWYYCFVERASASSAVILNVSASQTTHRDSCFLAGIVEKSPIIFTQ